VTHASAVHATNAAKRFNRRTNCPATKGAGTDAGRRPRRAHLPFGSGGGYALDVIFLEDENRMTMGMVASMEPARRRPQYVMNSVMYLVRATWMTSTQG